MKDNMKKNRHFFLDGYQVNEDILADKEKMLFLLNEINNSLFHGVGKIILIPYFNGKVKENGGVSGVVLGDGFHFTCHTFCFKNCFFVDFFGKKSLWDSVKKFVLKIFPTDDFDLCDNMNGEHGNFGKHIIVNHANTLSFEAAKNKISEILFSIDMTPISGVIINYKDEKNFDLLQPIAESHISVHRCDDDMVIDVFSCKWFDEKKLCEILSVSDFLKISRGKKYR